MPDAEQYIRELERRMRDMEGRLGRVERSIRVHIARVARSTTQSVADSTTTPISFDTVRFDTAGMADLTTSPTRLTARRPGVAVIMGHVRFAANGTGSRQAWIRINGSLVIARERVLPATGNATDVPPITSCYPVTAGDYVELLAVQDQAPAASLNVDTQGNYSPELSVVLIG